MSFQRLAEASTRRRLLKDPEPEDDHLPTSWTCSYVMSSSDGVNLLGTLDVDRNRARFVANSGLFGTAYQFVMPRDQIQIVRVPTASTPYNALELHTKYRQNILCDFDDNVATFKRCCEVMKLDVLPQDEPLIAVLPSDVSEHANKWRERAAAKRKERDAAELLASRGGGEPDNGEQLTRQVMHLHGEKLALQKKLTELERENKHLLGEVDVLYKQVEKESDRAGRHKDALDLAAQMAVDEMLASGREEMRQSLVMEKRAAISLAKEAAKETEAKKEVTEANRSAIAETNTTDSRKDELHSVTVAALKQERDLFETEIKTLRAELDTRDLERKAASAEAEALPETSPASPSAQSNFEPDHADDDMQDMLAAEVTRLLAKQAELSNHLARTTREKELLEKENELLYRQTEAAEVDLSLVRNEKDLACERLHRVSRAVSLKSEGGRSTTDTVTVSPPDAPSSPPRGADASVKNTTASTKTGKKNTAGKKKLDDGPDAELAAKLISRLEVGGESEEARKMRLEMQRMKLELMTLKQQAASESGLTQERLSQKNPVERTRKEKTPENEGLTAKEASADAAAAKTATAQAATREKEEALWKVTEATLRAADAERLVEMLRLEKRESRRKLESLEHELRSERSKSKAGSLSEVASTPVAPETAAPLSDRGWSVSQDVWQELLMEKESLLELATQSDRAKEDEIVKLKQRLESFEKFGKSPSGDRKVGRSLSPFAGNGAAGGNSGNSRLGSPRSPGDGSRGSPETSFSVPANPLPRINTGVAVTPDRTSPESGASTKENELGVGNQSGNQSPAEQSKSPLTRGLSAISGFAKRFSPG